MSDFTKSKKADTIATQPRKLFMIRWIPSLSLMTIHALLMANLLVTDSPGPGEHQCI